MATDRELSPDRHEDQNANYANQSLQNVCPHHHEATLRLVTSPARVVELADTTDSKSVAFAGVRVQVPPRVPIAIALTRVSSTKIQEMVERRTSPADTSLPMSVATNNKMVP